MKDPISITIPFEYHALTRASDFLHGLALDAKAAGMSDEEGEGATGIYERGFADGLAQGERSDIDVDRSDIEARIPASEGGTMPDGPGTSTTAVDDQHAPDPDHVPDEDYPTERDPSAAFGNGADNVTTAAEPGSAPHAETTAGAAHTAGAPEPARGAEDPAGAPSSELDLDADGLPWDGRIHSSSKKKLAKTKQWKKRRKPADQAEEQWNAYVDSVETELRRVMQAGPHAPVETKQPEPEPAAPAGPTGPTPPAAETKPAAPSPTPPPAETGEIKTLPELFRLITDNNIDDGKVMAAINAQGIESLPLLGARPDLIPAVAKALQEG